MIQTVVFDVDGTICFDGRTIEPPVVEALDTLNGAARVVFASARPIRDLLPVLPPQFHDNILIGGNGAFSRHHGELKVLGLSRQERALLEGVMETHHLQVLIDGDWDYCFTGDQEHRIFRQLDAGHLARNVAHTDIDTWSKVVLFTTNQEILDQLRAAGLSVTVHPDEGLVDIAPSGITKHHAITRLGIPDATYVAFGNDANDVSMLTHAHTSWCIGNHPALGFATHHITRDELPAAITSLT